jgi:hypothetical protein
MINASSYPPYAIAKLDAEHLNNYPFSRHHEFAIGVQTILRRKMRTFVGGCFEPAAVRDYGIIGG